MRAFSSVFLPLLALSTLSSVPVQAEYTRILRMHEIAGVGRVVQQYWSENNTLTFYMCFQGQNRSLPPFRFLREGKEVFRGNDKEKKVANCFRPGHEFFDKLTYYDIDQKRSTTKDKYFKNPSFWQVEVNGDLHDMDPMSEL